MEFVQCLRQLTLISVCGVQFLAKVNVFFIVSLSKNSSLCLMCSDQHVKCWMPHGFPLTSSLLLWITIYTIDQFCTTYCLYRHSASLHTFWCLFVIYQSYIHYICCSTTVAQVVCEQKQCCVRVEVLNWLIAQWDNSHITQFRELEYYGLYISHELRKEHIATLNI